MMIHIYLWKISLCNFQGARRARMGTAEGDPRKPDTAILNSALMLPMELFLLQAHGS